MTGAVASAEKDSDLADVHECKHSMNHLPTHDALWQAQSRENSDLSDVHECKHLMIC
jgi:hypothetical protein